MNGKVQMKKMLCVYILTTQSTSDKLGLVIKPGTLGFLQGKLCSGILVGVFFPKYLLYFKYD